MSSTLLDRLRALQRGAGGEEVAHSITDCGRSERSEETLSNGHDNTAPAQPAVSNAGVGGVVLDFETRNTGGCKLKAAGAWRYAADPTTEVLTLTFHLNGEHHLWTPATPYLPLASLAADPAITFICHAGFEQAIWHHVMVGRYGFLPIPIERWHDTQAACAYYALPLDLERALTALNLPVTKDKEGRRLTLSLSRPNRKTGAYPEVTPEKLARVAEYNKVDVEGTVALDKALGRLPKRERRVWELDQQINQRGVGIDLDSVRAAKKIADRLFVEAIEEFRKLTDLSPTQVEKVRRWLCENGTELEDLRAETVEETLKIELSPEARRVLEIRSMVASTSLKKLDRILSCVGSNGRARGLLQYHGATPGRWVGRLLQPQNFPRPTIKADPEELVAAVKTEDPDTLRKWGEPVEVLVSGLRHAIAAQGDALFGVGDFETIEARIVLALAGQNDKVKLLAEGVDVYRDAGADIFRLDADAKAEFLAADKKDLTPEQAEMRQTSKQPVLGAGFGLGWKGYRDRYYPGDDDFAKRVINFYRNDWAPKVPQLWYDLEHTAIRAMQNPGVVVTAQCGIRYRLETKAGLPFLVCQILNGKKFHYAHAALEMRTSEWNPRPRAAVTYWAIKEHQWRKVIAWHGHLTENVVQALARELLVAAMFRFEARGFPVVLTVHDEIVVEHRGITEEAVKEIMSERPQWAVDLGLPVAVEAWVGKRYRK
jgi:DNA polymerase bacteriophage-type